MKLVYPLLYTLLLQAKHLPFEEKSTHFIGAWTAQFTLANGTIKTFPVASYELYTNLLNGRSAMSLVGMMANECPSVHLASKLLDALGEGAHDYNVFVKQLAVLPPEDLQELFNALYCDTIEARSCVAEQLHHTHNVTDERKEPKTRSWWCKYRCVCPFLHSRNRWY